MTLPFYPKRELPRRVREALGQLDPADDIRTAAQIVDLVDELDLQPVWSALVTLRRHGFAELVARKKPRANSTWRLTALSRRAPTSIRFTKQQAAAIGVVEKLGGTATAAEAGHLVSKHLQRLRAMGVLTIQPDSRPWRYVLPALALLVLAVPAGAQTLHHPPHGAHDPFTGMRKPDGSSCCNGQDCAVAQSCMTPGGRLGWRERGACHELTGDPVPMPPELSGQVDLVVCRTASVWNGVFTPHLLCWSGGAGT